MTVKNVVEQIEHLYGRQAEGYMMRLINDALLEISAKKQHFTQREKMDLVEDVRWYELDDNVIDVFRVEIKDTNDSGVQLALLYPGEAIIFPRAGNGVVFHCSTAGGTGSIAIEYAIINDGT